MKFKLLLAASALAVPMILGAESASMGTWSSDIAPFTDYMASSHGTKGPKLSALVDGADKVFPKVLFGSGWETVIFVQNIGSTTVPYRQLYFGADGKPLPVTAREYPAGDTVTASSFQAQLLAGASFNFALFDTGNPTKEGWSVLSYDSSKGTLSGFAIIRHRATNGDFNFEATVPLSNLDDYEFYMSFDSIQGFTTALFITNPDPDFPVRLSLTFLAGDGKLILSDSITVSPLSQIVKLVSDDYPALANRLGVIRVHAATPGLLSATGLRFNGSSGAIASVPIMNWSGMFQ